MADICVASQAAGANFFKVDLAPYPTVSAHCRELALRSMRLRSTHPLKQPGAPAA